MAIVLIIMFLAAVLGGTIGLALSPDLKSRTWTSWGWNILVGLGAALLVPLFLSMVSSDLVAKVLSDDRKTDQLLVFGGFCLLAAISSRKFITTLTDKVLKEIEDNKRATSDLKEGLEGVAVDAKRAGEAALAAIDTAELGLQPSCNVRTKVALMTEIVEGVKEDDPWAGQFGGSPVAEGRRLDARVTPLPGRSDMCVVALRVSAVAQAQPLDGSVQFYLHPTFKNNKPMADVRDGEANLSFTSWGAFTVGAICDEGKTLLELDLARLPDAPEPWRSR